MKLDSWLKANRLSGAKFSKMIGVSHVMVYLVLRGKKRFSGDMILKIQEVTKGKVGPNDLIKPLDVLRKGRKGRAA